MTDAKSEAAALLEGLVEAVSETTQSCDCVECRVHVCLRHPVVVAAVVALMEEKAVADRMYQQQAQLTDAAFERAEAASADRAALLRRIEELAGLVKAARRVDKAIASVHGLGDQLTTEDAGLTINATWIDLRNALKKVPE